MSHPRHPTKINMPSKQDLEEVVLRPHSDQELEMTPELEEKIEKLMQFFDKSGIDYDKFNPESVTRLNLDQRKAYPNNDPYMHIPGQHDTKKWLETVKTVYYKEKNGSNRVQAIRQSTNGWNIMETYDFLNWLKYYESGDHMKYKFAQLWYENGAPGYFLHVKPDPIQEPTSEVSGRDIDSARDAASDSLSSAEKKSIIEKQRQKIVGRLDSAEKLMRTHEGQIFAGKEFEALLDAIYQLKKRVQMVNKISTSTRLYDDMIVRQANILVKNGFTKAAEVLWKLAQANNPPPPGTGKKDDESALTATPPAPPGQGSGSAGGLPSIGPGMAQNPPESAPNDAIADFLDNLETGKVTTKDNSQVEDSLEVEDTLNVATDEDDLLVTEAQMAPPADVPITDTPAPAPAKPSPVKVPIKPAKPMSPATEEPLEVTEDDIPKSQDNDAGTSDTSNFDSKIDQVFANITVADVVAKLEDLAKIYKTREVPRQLGIVDMMLDSLGLASYFPSLSEATNKALESNNYISTRLEDILSKLRGAMSTKEIDLKGGDTPDKPEVAGIKGKLKSDEDKEKNRKQMRRDQESAELEGKNKETPEVEIDEDLGAPPAPVAPKAPVAPRPV